MTKLDKFAITLLYVIAWLIFVGLSIEAGGLIVNFFFSVFKPQVVERLYQKLDLSVMYAQSKAVFFGVYSFIIFIAVLKAVLFYRVIQLVHHLNLNKPFSRLVSRKVLQISYYTFSIGIISLIARQFVKNVSHHGYTIDILGEFWVDSQAFILMATVIYIIAVIFKRGIEMQEENELTV
ncbi:MAG TPA: DUF2975 domain-containing protein [Ferruginibacter sp.]|nr:DUF2975 domain-containing protein [Ferruginibacter sp.]HRN80357.1 DUF2975 domain-containing protein [Ferruginibacter sp.]HRO18296.1 DUF2975 domain-containing protein [Ferruginibacter sp.]HRQ19660.1 DUF2975 domain-containing protein [Ferruginibacter sp.]